MKYLLLLVGGLFAVSLPAQNLSAPLIPSQLDSFYSPVKWRNIGPFRGGRSVTATGVIGDPLTYYMGTTGGGLWKTDDAGQRWSNISDDFFGTGSVGAVAVSASDPNVVYCGMGEHAPRGVMTSHGDGMYKSTDAGKTWSRIGLEQTQHISRIIIHPKDPDFVFVAAQGALHGDNEERGIYRSQDGGASWEKVLYVDENTGCSEISMDLSNPQVLYAAMWHHQRYPWMVESGGPGSALYKSTDGGTTWTKLSKGLPKVMGKMAIAVSQANPEKVYALIESDWEKEKGGLYVSNDAGKSWSQVSKDHRLVQRAWYYIEVFPDPNNENTVYVMSAPALRSIDGGKTWERLSGTHGDFHDLWINPNNSKNMVIANDGGAAISFNFGKTWSTQANMPTAQFYRVNVDNQFPYNVYGGQQDNSSVKIASRAIGARGISERHWSASAGGESAFLAFDPDDPTIVLGASYLGSIEALYTKANASTGIIPTPIQYLGLAARDMKYLYNWNSPIIWSKHESNTYYQAAQYLLRTRDLGLTWEEVSPDLTRNIDEKQGNGGGPITNEAVGAENYGTISYVIESPHEPGVIWTGSDDGLVHVTRDGCQSWSNVTPEGLEECLINAIDISPHDPATAYIATTRYKFNDKRPGLYKTTNYGKSWTKIDNGIPEGAYTRVVREDEDVKGFLLAGTELGIYASWNDGQSWERLQINMPVTPILDMIIRHGDVIVATSGRSFWILDDLGLLQQKAHSMSGLKLFAAEDAMLINGGSPLDGNSKSFDGTHPFQGVNPASGAVLYYHLPKLADSVHISLDILDQAGNKINSYSSKKDKSYKRWDGGPGPVPTLDKKKGLNRFVWDLRHEAMPGIPNVYIEGSWRGHKVSPGAYSIVLKQGDQESKQTLNVLKNPLYPNDLDYAGYDTFMSEMEDNLRSMHTTTNKLYKQQQQIATLQKDLGKEAKYLPAKQLAAALLKKMKSWDEEMVQRQSKAYDDVENFVNKFTANYLYLINATQSDIPRVNQGNRDRRIELDARWAELKSQADSIKADIEALNKALWEVEIGAVH